MEAKKKPELDPYVFIDVSNIRAACVKTLGFNIDFIKLIGYLRKKYPRLKSVYYYEGIANGDTDKQAEFDALRLAGYEVKSLERKIYVEPAVYKEITCRNCKTKRRVQVLKKTTKMKSNVDVYLATDLLRLAYLARRNTHIILVSCDGDYAEMIKSALETNPKITISVLGTPVVKNRKNTFSMRLQEMRGKIPNFHIRNIQNIQPIIAKQK